MPITQDRILRLLIAAERCRNCYISLRQAVMSAGPTGRSVSELMHHAQADAPGYDAISIIAQEREKWDLNHRRNESEAHRMAKRRARAKGLPEPVRQIRKHPTGGHENLMPTVLSSVGEQTFHLPAAPSIFVQPPAPFKETPPEAWDPFDGEGPPVAQPPEPAASSAHPEPEAYTMSDEQYEEILQRRRAAREIEANVAESKKGPWA